MIHGVLHYTKDGWVISYEIKKDAFNVVAYDTHKTIPLHPADVPTVQASISQMVDNDGRSVDFEIVSDNSIDKDENILYGKIVKITY